MKLKYVRLAELLVWLLILAAGLFSYVYNTHFKDKSDNTYYVFFDDVEGLVKGSCVRMMGINIGYVRNVKITDNKVLIAFEVTKKGIEIPRCAIATIEFYGLGGSISLELNPVTASENDDTKADIITSESYRVQDYYDGAALDARVLIDYYGSLGRNVTNEQILKYKPYAFQSGLVKSLAQRTKNINNEQIVIIRKLKKEDNI